MQAIVRTKRARAALAIFIIVLLSGGALLTARTLSAQTAPSTVKFGKFDDSLPNRCYDIPTTAVDPANPNVLKIGIVDTIDSATWQNRACIAGTGAFTPRQTTDTFSFEVKAPAGMYISKVTFSQGGTVGQSRIGQAFKSVNWVVAGDAMSGPGVADLTGKKLKVVPVSISTFLAAGVSGTSGGGLATALDPMITVEILPLVVSATPTPVPALR